MDFNITYRQKDKGWQYIISYKDDSGKWKQKSKQGFKKKQDAKPCAEKALKDLKDAFENKEAKINNDSDSLTFDQLASAYIEHNLLYKEHNTIKRYKNAISNFSTLKDMQVIKIKKIDINKCIDHMIEKDLMHSSISSHIGTSKLIFNYFIENYDANYINPVNNIKLAKDKTVSNKKALTKKELDILLNKLKDSKYYIIAYIAANTGLRCGEILGLTWSDINKKNMTVSVNKQWKVLKNGKSGFGPLKTKNSNRVVPVTAKFLKELDIYDKSNPRSIDNRIAHFNSDSIEKYLNPKLREYADISTHELRHTYATLLIANGVDFKTAAKILGHTVEMTLRTYSHVTDDMLKAASEKIKKIF